MSKSPTSACLSDNNGVVFQNPNPCAHLPPSTHVLSTSSHVPRGNSGKNNQVKSLLLSSFGLLHNENNLKTNRVDLEDSPRKTVGLLDVMSSPSPRRKNVNFSGFVILTSAGFTAMAHKYSRFQPFRLLINLLLPIP